MPFCLDGPNAPARRGQSQPRPHQAGLFVPGITFSAFLFSPKRWLRLFSPPPASHRTPRRSPAPRHRHPCPGALWEGMDPHAGLTMASVGQSLPLLPPLQLLPGLHHAESSCHCPATSGPPGDVPPKQPGLLGQPRPAQGALPSTVWLRATSPSLTDRSAVSPGLGRSPTAHPGGAAQGLPRPSQPPALPSKVPSTCPSPQLAALCSDTTLQGQRLRPCSRPGSPDHRSPAE